RVGSAGRGGRLRVILSCCFLISTDGSPSGEPTLPRSFRASSHSFLGSRSPFFANSIINFATVIVMGSLRSTSSSLLSAASNGFGLIGNIVVGIIGAFLAGWLLPLVEFVL